MGSRNRTVTNSIQNYIAQQQLLLLVSCPERGIKRRKKKSESDGDREPYFSVERTCTAI